MKKLFILFLLILPAALIYSQREYYQPTPEDLEQFFKTKTLVVRDDNPMSEYNFGIQDAMKSEWNATQFEFISNADFAAKSKDKNSSFIYTSILNFEKDRTDTKFIFLHLSLGGDNLTLDDLKDMVSMPLGYYGEDPSNYIYKIGLIVKFMQSHMTLISGNPDLVKANTFNYYNGNIPKIHDKVLYILKEDIAKDIANEGKIKPIYSHPLKIVTREEIEAAIEEADSTVVFLHKVGPKGGIKDARCYKIIIGADNGMVYYYDYHKTTDKNPNGFLKSDFTAINK